MTVIVVVVHESKDSLIKRRAVFLRLDVNVVIFYRSPKSFNPDVILCPAATVNADPHFRILCARFLPIREGELTFLSEFMIYGTPYIALSGLNNSAQFDAFSLYADSSPR